MLNVAIVCDDYKTNTFKKELDNYNFKYEVISHANGEWSALNVSVEEERVNELSDLVKKINAKFAMKPDYKFNKPH